MASQEPKPVLEINLRRQRHAKMEEQSKKIDIPHDVKPFTLTNHRVILNYLVSGEAKADRSNSLLCNRAVWYNRLDKQHTFNKLEDNCRANCAVMAESEARGELEHLSDMLRLYYAACQEESRSHLMHGPHRFQCRDAFVTMWQFSEEEFPIYTTPEIIEMADCHRLLFSVLENTERARRGGKVEVKITGVCDKQGDLPQDSYPERPYWIQLWLDAINTRVDEFINTQPWDLKGMHRYLAMSHDLRLIVRAIEQTGNGT